MFNVIKQLKNAEEGSVFVLVATSVMMLVIATGAAIDMARAQTLQAKMSSALDAAGLAAGATFNASATAGVDDVTTQATRVFNANFPSGYLGSGTVPLNASCADMSGNALNSCSTVSTYTISLSASTTQATTFMKVANISSVSVNASTQITRQTSGMELALVLDNTGSMSRSVDGSTYSSRHPKLHQPKIDALQCAIAGAEITKTSTAGISCSSEGLVTEGLLDVMYGNNTTLPDLFVGVVPFSDMVNLSVANAPGSTFVNSSYPLGVTKYDTSTAGGCLDSRNPATASTTDSGITLPSGDTIHLDIGDDAPKSSSTYFQALTISANGECPPAAVQPMSVNKSDAITAIKAMTANGSTLLPMGLAWGWRMLSPNWLGLWGATPTFTYSTASPPIPAALAGTTVKLPLPYNTIQMLKVVVFMTDGVNSNGYSNDSTNPSGSNNTDNAYDPQSSEPSNTNLDQLTKDVCDAMKSKGIIIYAIGFGTTDPNSPPTNSDRNGNNSYVDAPLLQYCATQNYTGDTSHFFLAPTNTQLEAAFTQIGQQLANLRVSQ